MEKFRILVINPGSTSTKIAVFDDDAQLFVENLEHDGEELRTKFAEIFDQYDFRKQTILDTLKEKGIALDSLSIVVARGGLLPPVPAGAIEVNDDMCWQLQYKPRNTHASNLGAPIALAIAREVGVKAYVYDPIAVDQLDPIAKISGNKEIVRTGMGHALNMRACAIRYAKEQGKNYNEMNFIVAHLGGGITLSCHKKGRMVEMVTDEEGPFSSTRSGGLPTFEVLKFAAQPGMTYDKSMKEVRSNSGLIGYLGTADARDVENRVDDGDEYAKLIYEAMAYQVARCIGGLAPVVDCKPDAIILTGGIAYSKMFTELVGKRVSALGDFVLMPGEFEMDALMNGALRLLRGEELASTFTKVE